MEDKKVAQVLKLAEAALFGDVRYVTDQKSSSTHLQEYWLKDQNHNIQSEWFMVNNGMDIIGFNHKSWFTAFLWISQSAFFQGDFQDFDSKKKFKPEIASIHW